MNDKPGNEQLPEHCLLRYWDNELSEDELAALNRALEEQPGLRAELAELSLQALGLAEHFSAQRFPQQSVAAPPKPSHPGERVATIPASPVFRQVRRWGAVAAAMFVAVVVSAWFLGTSTSPSEPVVARVKWTEGTLRVAAADGSETDLPEGGAITWGQTLQTQGDSQAQLELADGTQLQMFPWSSITFSVEGVGQQVRLLDGELTADVRREPSARPLLLATEEAEVRPARSRVSLSRNRRKTEIGVFGGESCVVTARDGHAVDVKPGQRAIAVPNKTLRPEPIVPAPDTFELSFGSKLPDRWRAGELITDNLPAGALAAVHSVPLTTRAGKVHYQIGTPNEWNRGLFTIHDDTLLHLRFRVDRPGFFHLLVGARGPDPTDAAAVNLEAPGFWKQREPGQWYTVSLPLSRFRRVGKRLNEPPPPLTAYSVIIDGQEVDRGLALERLWVTRGPIPADE
ncbi:MAG: FecR domain-containing protein [Gemmataceae bacterium]